jgi:hypothetical protein
MPVYERPARHEYAEFYASYVKQVPDGDLFQHLAEQERTTLALLQGLSQENGDFRYAPGKWTLKDVLAHVIDTERLFAFRALWFARDDPAPLPGMDPDGWAAVAGASQRSLTDLRDEYRAVRKATALLLRSFSQDAVDRAGTASGYRFTVRALAWIIAGHERHHQRVLRERYLPTDDPGDAPAVDR